MRPSLTAVAVLTSLSGLSLAQSTRHVAQTAPEGAGVLIEQGGLAPVVREVAPRAGVLWTFNDPVSIPQSVALGDRGDDSWVAHWLNDDRISHFDTTGPGTPDFVHALTAENPDIIGVEAARDRSLMAAIYWRSGVPVAVRAFNETNGATPLWTYTFGAGFTNSGQHGVDVSDDGSRIAACAFDGTDTKLVLLDDTGTQINSTTVAGYCGGVELSGDGSRILVTAGATARLYDAATMTEIYSLAASGSGGFHRISRDGSAIACGGFNIRAAREVGGVWQIAYSVNGVNQWFGWGVALSGDGRTLFAVAHNYAAGYLPNEHRLVDLTTGSPIGSWSYTGVGSLQNSVVGAEANDDGTMFVAASWGDLGNTQPEVRIFDRNLTMIGSIDTPGSPFDVDMTGDGKYVLVGTKAVHANNFGSGGNTYLYQNDVASCAPDLNGDGVLNFFDVQLFLSLFASNDPAADFNADGALNFFDVQLFLSLFSAGCP